MIISTNIHNNELERISNIIEKGKVTNIHEFIKYAILNQLEIEETFDDKESITFKNVVNDQSKQKESSNFTPPIERKGLNEIELSAIDVKEIIKLDLNAIKSRTIHPIWSMKNRYFPTKYALRVIQKLVMEEQKNRVNVHKLYNEITSSVLDFRKKLEFIDKVSENKRGNRITAGFPNEKKPHSMTRFLRNFVVTISADGKTVSGLLYDLGFIDVQDGNVSITQYGNEFANLESPIIDQKANSIGKRLNPFSDEELDFLIKHAQNSTNSESSLMNFIMRKLSEKNLTPEELNDNMVDYLNHEYEGDKKYSIDLARSLRVGLTSRMVEIGLIDNIRRDGGSFYQISEKGRKIMEGG